MRAKVIALLLCMSAIFLCACATPAKGYYSEPGPQLDVASEYNGSIYFILPVDSRLYRLNNDNKTIDLVYDAEMTMFAYTNNSLFFVDKNGDLVRRNLTNGECKTMASDLGESYRAPAGFSYTPVGEILIYDDRVIYKNQQNELVFMNADGEQISKMSREEVVTFQKYQNMIYIVTKNNKLLDNSMTIKLTDLNGKLEGKLIDCFFYDNEENDGWIYYSGYERFDPELIKANPITGEKCELFSSSWIVSFKICNDMIFAGRGNELIASDLNGDHIEVIAKGDNVDSYRVINANQRAMVYLEYGKDYIGIYNTDDKSISKIVTDNELHNCVVFDDMLYLSFDEHNDAGEPNEMNSGFYTFDGREIYTLNEG